MALIFISGSDVQSGRQSYMIPVNAQIWTEADVSQYGSKPCWGEISNRRAGVKIALIDAQTGRAECVLKRREYGASRQKLIVTGL